MTSSLPLHAYHVVSKSVFPSSCKRLMSSAPPPPLCSRRQDIFQLKEKIKSETVRFVSCSSDLKKRRNCNFNSHCSWLFSQLPVSTLPFQIANCVPSIRPFATVPEAQQRKSLEKSGPVPVEVVPLLTLPQKFVARFPEKFHPYLKLSRIDRPIGTWLLFWPSTWGLTVASGGMPDLTLLALFGGGAFVMRGAGCTVNDMWDRRIDPQVQRTSTRPLASGQIRLRHAVGWLGAQLSIAFGILLQLNPSCFPISCGALGLVCLYPLAKRVTYWPQAVLGLTFNTGILIGYAAAQTAKTGFLELPYLDPACLSLYSAGILWTLIYDTIYAHQDLKDDTLLGLGSTARRFGDSTKLWLSGFSCLMVSSLTMTGILAELPWPYYLGLGGVSAHLVWQIYTLNIKNAENCGQRFTSNRHIGWVITVSLLISYCMKNNENSLFPNKFQSRKSSEPKDSIAILKYRDLNKESVRV